MSSPTIGPDGTMERKYADIVLNRRLQIALKQLNPNVPANSLYEALRRVVRISSADLIVDNRDFHSLLTDGVSVEYRHEDGSVRTTQVQLFDFENPDNNDFVAINQLTVVQDKINRRPDVVLFVNGIPLVVIELKNATSSESKPADCI